MSLDTEQWSQISVSLRYLAEHLHEVAFLLIPFLRVDSRTELVSVRGQAGNWGSVIPAFWGFMLAPRERGLGTALTTCHLSYERDVADVLGLLFDTQAALTPVAYTGSTEFRPGPRANRDEFIH